MRFDWLAIADPGDVYPVTEPCQARVQEVLDLEAVDWIPTASVLSMPTSYVAAGSCRVPDVLCRSDRLRHGLSDRVGVVTPTTYLAPSYYETRFRRRGLFGRRLVETTRAYYIPTTAYYATTYYYPTMFRSTAIVDAAAMPTLYARTTSTRCYGESEPAEDDSIPSNVPSSPPERRTRARLERRPAPRPAPRLRNLHQIASNCLPPRSFPDRSPTVRSTPSALTAAKPAAQGQGVADWRPRRDPRRGAQVDHPTWPARLRGPRTW